jgi:hypothetical protein
LDIEGPGHFGNNGSEASGGQFGCALGDTPDLLKRQLTSGKIADHAYSQIGNYPPGQFDALQVVFRGMPGSRLGPDVSVGHDRRPFLNAALS